MASFHLVSNLTFMEKAVSQQLHEYLTAPNCPTGNNTRQRQMWSVLYLTC